MNLMSVWSAQRVPEQPALHSEILSKKKLLEKLLYTKFVEIL